MYRIYKHSRISSLKEKNDLGFQSQLDASKCVAVVGFDCSFPDIENRSQLFEFLKQKKNSIRKVPKDRFNVDAFYSENKNEPAMIYCKHAGIIDG